MSVTRSAKSGRTVNAPYGWAWPGLEDMSARWLPAMPRTRAADKSFWCFPP